MNSWLERFSIPCALVAFAVFGPGDVAAQAPTLVRQWDTNGISGIAVDATGNVYAATLGNNRVLKFDGNGVFLLQWSLPGDWLPLGIDVDAVGHVIVTSEGHSQLGACVFTDTGDSLRAWGPWGRGIAQLNYPVAVATDHSRNIYVLDTGNERIQKFDPACSYITQWASSRGALSRPMGILVDALDHVYVADTDNSRVQEYDNVGHWITQWGTHGAGPGQFDNPSGLAADAAGNIYVADGWNSRIQVFSPGGTFLMQWGIPALGDGRASSPCDIAIDLAGNIFVADQSGGRILEYIMQPTQVRSTTWGRVKSTYR